MLSSGFGLSAGETRLLDHLEQHSASEALHQLLRRTQSVSGRTNQRRLAGLLGLPEPETPPLLARAATLRRLGLIDVLRDRDCDLEDFVRPTTLLHEVFNQRPQTVEALLDLLIEPAPPAAWTLSDFPHQAIAIRQLGTVIAQASERSTLGVNALFYGAPGIGKTELARADRGPGPARLPGAKQR